MPTWAKNPMSGKQQFTPRRFDIWLVNLNPVKGREISKTRPCVIISPDELEKLATIIAAPMTTKGFAFPCRLPCHFDGKDGLILLDQIRAVDKSRLVKKLGRLDEQQTTALCALLQEFFAC